MVHFRENFLTPSDIVVLWNNTALILDPALNPKMFEVGFVLMLGILQQVPKV